MITERFDEKRFLQEALEELAADERKAKTEQSIREAATALSVTSMPGTPPWSPIPLQRVREFQRQNPAAQINFNFPTVYEENRTEKIKDLSAAQELHIIAHRRMSELVANELGIEQYDYDAEIAVIKTEQQDPLFQPQDPASLMGQGGTLFDAINKKDMGGNAITKQGSLVPGGIAPVGMPGAQPPAAPGMPPGNQIQPGGNRRDDVGGQADASLRRTGRGFPGRA